MPTHLHQVVVTRILNFACQNSYVFTCMSGLSTIFLSIEWWTFFSLPIKLKLRKLHSATAATPKHSICKDVTTIWLMLLSFFFFSLFFSIKILLLINSLVKILLLIVKYWVIAQCRVQYEKYFRWVNFIICILWNDSKV